MHRAHYSGRDYLFAALTALLVLVLASSALKTGIDYWGDDYAAYMNQGFALVDGRLDEQLTLNTTMHPTLLPDEVKDGKLVYAWGFPLLEALVYRIVGFDRTDDYNQLVYYKLILLISLALCSGVMVLFFRRRFPLWISVIISLLFCLNSRLLQEINMLYGDLVFLCFSMLTFLLAECFVFSEKPVSRILTGLGYAVSMWFTYLLRLNGFTVIVIALIGHVLCFIQKKIPFSIKKIGWHLLPYALFGAMILITNRILPEATQNISDFSRTNLDSIIHNLRIVISEPYYFFDNTTRFSPYIIGVAVYLFAILGLCTHGVKENLYLVILWLGTSLVLLFLPYSQGVRYLYNALPVMLMFAVYGIQIIWQQFDLSKKPIWKMIGSGALSLLLIFTIVPQISDVISNFSGLKDDGRTGVYSDDAIEAYQFIQENVDENEIIAFGKPRGLYLSTGRVTIWPGRNGHKLKDADYLLINRLNMFEYSYYKESEVKMYYECVFENQDFALYDLRKRVSKVP